jgi:Ca2+-binding RTX toxin-like protein
MAHIVGTSGPDTLYGTEDDDFIEGLGGDDTLYGLGGNDTLDGGAGADSMIGGADNDFYVVDNALDVVTEAAGEGTDAVQASVTYTLSNNVESLTLTGSANINGTGNSLANAIAGNSGSNILTGGDGNDALYGLGSNDWWRW